MPTQLGLAGGWHDAGCNKPPDESFRSGHLRSACDPLHHLLYQLLHPPVVCSLPVDSLAPRADVETIVELPGCRLQAITNLLLGNELQEGVAMHTAAEGRNRASQVEVP